MCCNAGSALQLHVPIFLYSSVHTHVRAAMAEKKPLLLYKHINLSTIVLGGCHVWLHCTFCSTHQTTPVTNKPRTNQPHQNQSIALKCFCGQQMQHASRG